MANNKKLPPPDESMDDFDVPADDQSEWIFCEKCGVKSTANWFEIKSDGRVICQFCEPKRHAPAREANNARTEKKPGSKFTAPNFWLIGICLVAVFHFISRHWPASDDASAYVGVWESPPSDSNNGNTSHATAYLMKISEGGHYEIKVRRASDTKWWYCTSGSWAMTTVTMTYDPKPRPAISLSNNGAAAFYDNGLDVQYLEGTIRIFTSTGRFDNEFH